MSPRWWWIAVLLGLLAAGCNEPCQTFCDSITEFYDGCVVPPDEAGTEDVTWGSVGAESAEEYHATCLARFERTLVVARTEDRNVIYDWCVAANMTVATQTECDGLELPEEPDLLVGEKEEDQEETTPGM